MTKCLFLICLVLVCCLRKATAQDFYAIQFTGLDGTAINTSAGVNKLLIVVAFDAANPISSQMKALDSIYRKAGNAMLVIGIPVNDFSPVPQAVSLLGVIRDSLNVSFPIASISQGKAGTGQQLLMRWLTTNSPKNHFKVSFTTSGQLFIVAPNGLLYGVLGPQVPIGGPDMQHILNNWPTQ